MKIKQTITLIYFKDKSGKALTFKLRSWLFKLIVVSALCFFGISLFAVYFSYKEKKENNDILAELDATEKENRNMKAAVKEMETKKTVFNEQIKKPVAIVETPSQSAPSEEPAINTGVITMENIRTKRSNRGDGFLLFLDLVKLQVSNAKLSGYVYIVWKASGKYKSFPESEEIKNGIPVDYKEGDTFDIRYRKPISWKITSNESDIQSLTVVVFGSDGNIVLKEDITRKALESNR
ncbi:MAG: hypothetical protein H7844_12020 [Nitrospirae bacterium YQR-1]